MNTASRERGRAATRRPSAALLATAAAVGIICNRAPIQTKRNMQFRQVVEVKKEEKKKTTTHSIQLCEMIYVCVWGLVGSADIYRPSCCFGLKFAVFVAKTFRAGYSIVI